jgi:4-hydroxy-tetrahydrodipicolinate reductase
VLRVAVAGARGKVGREVVRALQGAQGVACVAEIEADDDLVGVLRSSTAQILVDFTTPQAGRANAVAAARLGVRPVVGTTGLGGEGIAEIRAACAASGIGGCVVPNFAVGAALMLWFAEVCADYFESCEIVEAHHRGKLDAPSGTALRTAERLVAARRGRPFARSEPETTTLPGTRGGSLGGIGVHSLRLDGVVADQEVVFGTAGQTLTIAHRTTSREAFVPGVLAACRAVCASDRFFESLEEILGLPPASEIARSMPSSAP